MSSASRVDDAIILPMVVIAFLAKTLFQAAFFIMAFASAFVLALLLRVVTSVLLSCRYSR